MVVGVTNVVAATVLVFVKSGIVVGDMVVVLCDTREVEDSEGSVEVRTAFSVAGGAIVGPEKTSKGVGVTVVVV